MKNRNILKRLISLLSRGQEKLFYLVREKLHMIEVKILLAGLALSAVIMLFLSYLLLTDLRLYNILSSAAVMNVVGGRALGIMACLKGGIPIFFTVIYNFILELVVVLLTYGIVVLAMRNIIQPKIFKSAVRQAELTAQTQKTKIKKFGAIGLFLFVMFPFFMTGPVIGVIIGYLLNYKAVNNLLIVSAGTLTSIIIYSYAGNEILRKINQYIHLDVLKKWGGIIIALLIVVFLIYHFKTIKAFLYDEDEEDEE